MKENQYGLRLDPGGHLQVAFGTAVAGTWTWTGSTPAIPTGQWTHVAATYDGLAVQLFVNGQLSGLVSYPNGPLSVGSGALTVGGRASNPSGGTFIGTIDEVRVSAIAKTFHQNHPNVAYSSGRPLVYGWITQQTSAWVHRAEYDVPGFVKQSNSSYLRLTYRDNVYTASNCGQAQMCLYRVLVDGNEVSDPAGACYSHTFQSIQCGGGGPWVGNDVTDTCIAKSAGGSPISAGPHTITVQHYGWCCVGGCGNGNNGWTHQGITVEEVLE